MPQERRCTPASMELRHRLKTVASLPSCPSLQAHYLYQQEAVSPTQTATVPFTSCGWWSLPQTEFPASQADLDDPQYAKLRYHPGGLRAILTASTLKARVGHPFCTSVPCEGPPKGCTVPLLRGSRQCVWCHLSMSSQRISCSAWLQKRAAESRDPRRQAAQQQAQAAQQSASQQPSSQQTPQPRTGAAVTAGAQNMQQPAAMPAAAAAGGHGAAAATSSAPDVNGMTDRQPETAVRELQATPAASGPQGNGRSGSRSTHSSQPKMAAGKRTKQQVAADKRARLASAAAAAAEQAAQPPHQRGDAAAPSAVPADAAEPPSPEDAQDVDATTPAAVGTAGPQSETMTAEAVDAAQAAPPQRNNAQVCAPCPFPVIHAFYGSIATPSMAGVAW